MHFLPFNPVDKRTAITYIDGNGDWHRSSKGAPEQVMKLKNADLLLTYAILLFFSDITLLFVCLFLVRSLSSANSKERQKEKPMKLSMVLLNVGFVLSGLHNRYVIYTETHYIN